MKPYRNLFKEREIIDKDCCSNRCCMKLKGEEVSLVKYGHKSYASTDESKSYKRKLHQTSKEEVIELAGSKGITILNIDEYENDRTRLMVICSKHSDKGAQDTNFANIKKNVHCCKYIRHDNDSQKLDSRVVIDAFIAKDLIPLFEVEDYQNNGTPLPYHCPKHIGVGVQFRTYANLTNQRVDGCYYCAKEKAGDNHRVSFDKIKEKFLEKGLEILDGEVYKNKEEHLRCRCIHHPDKILLRSYGTVRNTKEPCPNCRNEKSLSDLSRFLRSTIISWRNASEKNCNYECILTGSKDYDVHHLYSFSSIIKDTLEYLKIDINDYNSDDIIAIKKEFIKRHEELLGVCLDKKLHILFHQIYSKENNTYEQFEEFKNNYIFGSYENVI